MTKNQKFYNIRQLKGQDKLITEELKSPTAKSQWDSLEHCVSAVLTDSLYLHKIKLSS